MKTFLCALFGLSLATFAAAPPPDNNDFANRTALVASGSISIAARNASATSEASEPTIDGEVVWRSVWWSWTAPFSGPTTITTAGSSFDTLLGVFTGTSIATLASIAENDDAGGLYTSSVTFQAVGGVPYALLVGGVNNAGGKVKLAVNVAAGPCSFALSPSSRSVSNVAGSSTVGVTTTTGCTWSALSNDAWLTVTAGSSGSGSGTVSYSIAANTALTSRTGTLTVAGLTHTVVQAAAPACAYSIIATNASFTASPATNSFVMTAGTGCAWTATPNASWLTIQSGASGTGNGTTTYVVATNSLSNQRVGTITVAGLTHTVTQAGTVPCTWSISPTSASFTSSGGTSNIVVSTQTACAWTASSPASWVTFSTTNGTGNATVTYAVATNSSTVARSTTLTVAGNSFTVTQSGAACTYSLSPTSVSVSSTGTSSGTITVTAGLGCAWTATANATWLTVTSGSSGSGNGTVGYSVAANPDTASRTNSLTIGGQTFTVTQAAAPCSFSIAPTAAHYSDTSATGSIAVTAGTGCAWSAVSNDAFITVNSGTPGSGSGTVGYTVAANVTTSSRTGTITVAGSTFTITQDGTTPCTYGISPSSASYTSTGGSSSVAVTANAGCTWSASSAASWVTISTASGSGNGTVGYTVAANTSSQARTGNLTIAGNPFTVSQSGAPCVFAISPTTSTFAYTGGSGAVTVTATSGCAWTSSSDSSWLTATNGANGTGNGTLIYSVASVVSPVTRTGRLTIAGKLLIVTQTGAPCVASLLPVGASVPDTGGGGGIALTESDPACTWTATNSATWITVSPSSGTGSAILNFSVDPTVQQVSRSGTITVAGQTFNITQDGDSTLPVVSVTAPSNGSTVSNVITLSATSTDNINMSRVEFYRDGAVMVGTDFTTPYNLPFNTTNLSNGTHTFYARGVDASGNIGSSTTNTVTVLNGSAPSDSWVLQFGNTGSDTTGTASYDAGGNVVLAGMFFSPPINMGGGSLTNAGSRDLVLAKFSSSGAHQWSTRYGSTGNEQIISTVLDASSNIYVVGTFSGTANLGGSDFPAFGQNDIFVARYSPLGVHMWSRHVGGIYLEDPTGITLSNGTNVVITGWFRGTINAGGTNLTTSGTYPFLASYASTDGTHLWSKTFANPNFGSVYSMGIDSDASGNLFIAGHFSPSVNFGGTNLVNVNSLHNDMFMAKFTALGAHIWSRRYGDTNSEFVSAVRLDSLGDLLVGGYFNIKTDVGRVLTGNAIQSGVDLFVGKYSSTDGTCLWAKSIHGIGTEFINALASDSSGNVLLAAEFNNTLTLSNGSTVSCSGAGSPLDALVVKYNPIGDVIWARSYGGSLSGDTAKWVSCDASGYPVVTGFFSATGVFNGQSLTTSGSNDIFLMRILP